MKFKPPSELAELLSRLLSRGVILPDESAWKFITDIEMDVILNGDSGQIDAMLDTMPHLAPRLATAIKKNVAKSDTEVFCRNALHASPQKVAADCDITSKTIKIQFDDGSTTELTDRDPLVRIIFSLRDYFTNERSGTSENAG